MSQKRPISNIFAKRLISILEYKNIKKITKSELLEIIKNHIKTKNPINLINYLRKHKKLISVKRNIYLYIPVSSIDNKPLISEYEINEIYLEDKNYYIGFINAFNYYGFTNQIPNKLFVFNTKYNLDKKIINFNIKYIKIPKNKMFGIIKNKYPFSDIEKTIIDVLEYHKYYDSLDKIIYKIKQKKDLFNENKLINYAKKLNSIKLLKLIGIITENKKLYNYLEKNKKLNYYTKIKNTNLKKRFKKWKIMLI